MKRYLFLFLIVTIYGCREQANRPARTIPRTSVASYSNPLLTSGADPYAIYHDGVYYYTQSMYDHLSIWKTKDITDLRHARSKTVWLPDDLTNSRDLWAPELHYLDGKWYLYYAAAGIRPGAINYTYSKTAIRTRPKAGLSTKVSSALPPTKAGQ